MVWHRGISADWLLERATDTEIATLIDLADQEAKETRHHG